MMTERSPEKFEAWRRHHQALVEERLAHLLGNLEESQALDAAELIAAMQYSVLGGGKRLRPLLALAAAEAVGGRAEAALGAALAVELVHCYSLIHDDLPALDNDDMRRGKPTCHKAYGEATAILAGDALLTLAFGVLSVPRDHHLESARRNLRAVAILAGAAGPLGMVGGQVMDLALEKKAAAAEEIRAMEIGKTGCLIGAALAAGAALAGASEDRIEAMLRLGRQAGLAFQIKDDLLNLEGDPALLGKAVGSDAQRGKATLPAVLGLDAARRELETLSAEALAATGVFGAHGANLTHLIESLTARQK